MKKVWVLQRWVGPAEMAETHEELKEYAASAKEEGEREDVIACFEKAAQNYEKKMEANPDGYWLGYVGRSKYQDFCYDAKETLRYFLRKMGEDSKLFKVVEGTIEDGAKTWTGYKTVKENAGVLRYLLATM